MTMLMFVKRNFLYHFFFSIGLLLNVMLMTSALADSGSEDFAYIEILATAETSQQPWQYTTMTPGINWYLQDFDDSGWTLGNGGFGNPRTPGAIVETQWYGDDIWLRQSFNPGVSVSYTHLTLPTKRIV